MRVSSASPLRLPGNSVRRDRIGHMHRDLIQMKLGGLLNHSTNMISQHIVYHFFSVFYEEKKIKKLQVSDKVIK